MKVQDHFAHAQSTTALDYGIGPLLMDLCRPCQRRTGQNTRVVDKKRDSFALTMPVEIPSLTVYFFLSFSLIKAKDIYKISVNSPDQLQKSPTPLSRQRRENVLLLCTFDFR